MDGLSLARGVDTPPRPMAADCSSTGSLLAGCDDGNGNPLVERPIVPGLRVAVGFGIWALLRRRVNGLVSIKILVLRLDWSC